MAEPQDLCVQPAKGPIAPAEPEAPVSAQAQGTRGGVKMTAQVGKPAPDFEASAFVDGGFRNIRLSEYSGQWVVLCFYPGDFTFV